jgi:putative spermidine/putrescine transport system permease protein
LSILDTPDAVVGVEISAPAVGPPRRRRRRHPLRWLGVVPFFAFFAVFLIVPTVELIIDAFKGANGHFTFANVDAIVHAPYLGSFESSLELSGLSALMGGVLGFLVANAVAQRGVPRALRPIVVTFSGMASNFAGVPLAFAFTATIGTGGVVTDLLSHAGIHLTTALPSSSILFLALVYTYFQFPLMILLVIPAIDGLKPEWREASSNLGATSWGYWRYVGLPILLPSMLGMMVLLFGSAFAAYATAYAISGSTGNLVPEVIGNLTNGNITTDPQLAYALAFGMIVIVTVTLALYTLLQRRGNRWLR